MSNIDRHALKRVIATINGKGGVGKTTITANVGGILAAQGWKVLLVDMDPQGNLGLDLGYWHEEGDDDGAALWNSLENEAPLLPLTGVRENLDVVRGGRYLHEAQAFLTSTRAKRGGRDPRLALAKVLAPLAKRYHVVIIDCPPLSDALQEAAIAAAKWLVVPVNADRASVAGLEEVADRIANIAEVNREVDLLGVALLGVETQATRVQREAKLDVAEVLKNPDDLFSTMVRHSNAVSRKARKLGRLVPEIEHPSGGGTEASLSDDYHNLTAEIVSRMESKKEAAK